MASETSPGVATLVALAVFLVVSILLGSLAQRAIHRGSFMQGYFLGNRGLGAWALALTATVQSGGTFMGYPSLIYSYGWVVALWIASYMVVPITGFGVLAKRLAQLSRRSGAITIPDLFRERFASPAAGLVSSLLILFILSFMMVAQFKAGASIMRVVWPTVATAKGAALAAPGIDGTYLIGLSIFAITVVGYTTAGGFLAAVWTDLFQSVLMWLGVLLLLVLTLWHVGSPADATIRAVENTSPQFALPPGHAPDGRQFLSQGLAISFFFVWTFGGMGSPATLVRLMAVKDTQTIRRSIFLLSVYNVMIYIPLMIICVAARSVMPDLAVSDEVIPRMAVWTTRDLWGGPLLAGLILVAPFGAVMATVSSYLVVIASGVVRDIYQRLLRVDATERELRWLTYAVMATVGLIAFLANLRPVTYLQAIVVFCSSSGASSFVVPAIMAAYWRRATAAGAVAAMLSGAGMCLALLIAGSFTADPLLGPATSFRSYYIAGMEPVVWGLLASALAGISVSLLTRPPPTAHVSKLFDAVVVEGSK